jgi:hypothetical protein
MVNKVVHDQIFSQNFNYPLQIIIVLEPVLNISFSMHEEWDRSY